MSYVSKQFYGKRKRQGRKRKLECQREVRMGAGGWGGCTGVGGVSLMEMVTHDKGRKLAVTGGGTFQALEVWGPQGWSTLCWFQAMWLPQGQLGRRQREGPCGLSLTVAGLGSWAEERPDLISILKASLCCCAVEVGRLWVSEQVWGEDQKGVHFWTRGVWGV